MRKSVVSLAAVLVLLASFATPSFAGPKVTNSYNGEQFNISITTPTTVQAGQTFQALGTISLAPDANASRKAVVFSLQVEGVTLNRQAVRAMPTGRTKRVSKTFLVPERLSPGTYNVVLTVNVNGEIGHVTTQFEVTK